MRSIICLVGTAKVCHKNDATLVPFYFYFLYLGVDPSVNSLGRKIWSSPGGSLTPRVSLKLNRSVNAPLARRIVH